MKLKYNQYVGIITFQKRFLYMISKHINWKNPLRDQSSRCLSSSVCLIIKQSPISDQVNDGMLYGENINTATMFLDNRYFYYKDQMAEWVSYHYDDNSWIGKMPHFYCKCSPHPHPLGSNEWTAIFKNFNHIINNCFKDGISILKMPPLLQWMSIKLQSFVTMLLTTCHLS